MAEGSYFVWIPLLLCCVFQASDNIYVSQGDGNDLISQTGNSEVDQILANLPINLPEGIDPQNINVTSVVIKACVGVKEELTRLHGQLQQTTQDNRKLNEETSGLKREVRQLNLQLDVCRSTASAITGSYENQLRNKLKQALGTIDNDTFLILKAIALTRERNTLQKRLRHAANSTTDITVLERKLQEKNAELDEKIQTIQETHANASLILQMISLQNEIWNVEPAKSSGRDLQPDARIMALQAQIDRLISHLQSTGDTTSAMLELIYVHSKITMLKRLITVHVEESRTNIDDYQKQWKQKVELLKKKIVQLSRDERNTVLTNEILKLQTEITHFAQLLTNTKRETDSQIREFRVIVQEEEKRQIFLQKQLEEADYAQAQQILKIINIMKVMRELQVDEQDETGSTSQATTLQTLLQAKEREYAKAQAEINELQRKLQSKSKECAGHAEIYNQVKTEFEQNIAELNRTGDSKAALILSVINLHDELKTLREQIATTDDQDRLPELLEQLQDKEEELKSKAAEVERLIESPKTILKIIELQAELRDLQRKANGTNSDRINELQERVDGWISELGGKGEENTKLMLKIISLEGQVEQLQRQLSDLQTLQTSQGTQLRNDLSTKRRELQQYVNELNEKNQTNARLILTVTDLQNQLRNLESERQKDNTTLSSTVTRLREQLKARTEELSRDQARIDTLQTQLEDREGERARAQAEVRELQRKLRVKIEECAGLEGIHEQVKADLEQRIAELNRTGEAKAAVVLEAMNLHDELKTLRELISTTDDRDRISVLQGQLEEKQEELNSKTTDIERLIANPQNMLRIIELQNQVRDLQKSGANDDQIKELHDTVDVLIGKIDDESEENTKLMLKIISLQSQVDQLQRQLSGLQNSKTGQGTRLRKALGTTRAELQKSVTELLEKNSTSARLTLEVANLQNQLKDLEKQKHDKDQETSGAINNLRRQLREKVEEHTRDRAEIEALQKQLNQTEEQCSNFEQKLKGLQNDLDAKMKELQSKSDTITSLALQVSTLTLQLEELKRQLQNTDSEAKIKELQKTIDEKTNELDRKTEELKSRSAQPQRFLQIIAVQTQIERLVNVAANESDYNKIRGLQDHLNYLIDGIQDENSENTKLMFQILAQQDEIARLKKQKEKQTEAELAKIKELEDELEDVRNQIAEKTQMLESTDTRIANLSAQIMELHTKIKPLEDEIEDLKEENTENLADLEKRLNLSTKQLQDSELRLKDADAKNFDAIMEIADLRAKLKKAQKKASRASGQDISELEQQIQTLQRENKKLEKSNKDLKQEVKELSTCCSVDDTQCDDQELQQSRRDVDRLMQQLHERDASINQLQTDLEEQIVENNRLHDDYNNLQKEKERLEDYIQDLRENMTDVEDKTIRATRVMLDPDTANPRVLLSAGNTRMSTIATPQNVPDHPGRFDVSLAVLGKTGFSAGRHYWEVSVAGKVCYHLGMASESAPRRGGIRYNPDHGYWTIVLNKQGQYRALDRRPTSIPVQTQPATLGILLDYKQGQISFYDAGARSHMYTFTGQRFKDKIFPFINFCVEDVGGSTSVVLRPPGSVDWVK